MASKPAYGNTSQVKVIIDFIIGTKPKFLGEKIEIK